MRAWQAKLWRLGADASLGTTTRLMTSRPATTETSPVPSFSCLQVATTRASTASSPTSRRILRSSSTGYSTAADGETKEEQADGLLFQRRSRLSPEMNSLLKIDGSIVRRPHTSYNIISHSDTTTNGRCKSVIASSGRKPLIPRSAAVLPTQSSASSPSSSLQRARLELFSTMSPYVRGRGKELQSYDSSHSIYGASFGQRKATATTARAASRLRY